MWATSAEMSKLYSPKQPFFAHLPIFSLQFYPFYDSSHLYDSSLFDNNYKHAPSPHMSLIMYYSATLTITGAMFAAITKLCNRDNL